MKKKLYWVLISIFAVIFLVSGSIVVKYVIDSHQHQQKVDNYPTYPRPTFTPPTSTSNQPTTSQRPTLPPPPPITSIPGTTGTPVPPTTLPPVSTQPPEPVMLESMVPFYEINPDVVGFISVEGTKIHYPVLQRKEDKDYYLYRDLYGKDDQYGSIYIREACDVFAPSDNITFYGHHMVDGTMFANIMNFKKKDFFDAHKYIQFDTLYEQHTYEIICVFRTSGTYGVGFPFHLYDDFADEAEFNEFITGIRRLAINDSGIDVEYGDKFICLSTCEYSIKNGRMVLVAKRIS